MKKTVLFVFAMLPIVLQAQSHLKKQNKKVADELRSKTTQSMNTGSNHSVMFIEEAYDSLDELADVLIARSTDGMLVGYTKIKSGNNMLAVWGNDIYSEQIDGMLQNEKISFSLLNSETNEVYQVLKPSFSLGDDNYRTNGISIINSFEIVKEGSKEIKDLMVSPNPANTTTALRFELDHSSSYAIEVYDALGQKVFYKGTEPYEVGVHTIDLDIAKYPTGVYTILLTDERSIHSTQFIKSN